MVGEKKRHETETVLPEMFSHGFASGVSKLFLDPFYSTVMVFESFRQQETCVKQGEVR
jgi:hypothetical protein